MIAVDLGDGPQVRRLTGGTETLNLKPLVTESITVSLLDWDNVIDRTALGFDQLKPPGLAEIVALDPSGVPIAAADAVTNRARTINMPCGRGPIIGVAGQFVQTSVSTTVGALLDNEPIPARPCRSEPITLPAGQQELLISPGPAFIVDGVQLAAPLAGRLGSATTGSVDTDRWTSDHRDVEVPPSDAARVLVVPESVNPGWTARSAAGAPLTAVTVNGWQQGWVLPAGTDGTVALSFTSNATYRAGLIGGLALLPLLIALAFLPVRRRRAPGAAARPWHPPTATRGPALIVAAAVISGLAGVVLAGAALGIRYLLRERQNLWHALTVGTAAAGLILAGAVLSQNPWRSVDGYVGHSAGVQLLALLSVVAVAVSAVPFAEPVPSDDEDG
jgi:arabinofuranan 3-O-arabinosyltransferase